MRIWTLEQLQALVPHTMMANMGVEFTGMGENWLSARMPVNESTKQTWGYLHGGASAALIESLASVGAQLCVDREKFRCFGIELNANHVRSVTQGHVVGTARPQHIGRSIQVWEVRIEDAAEAGRLVSLGRLTVAVRPARPAPEAG